ncbi:MAG: diacylglycerol kinase family protein [Pyrinomonadaceae bacterium]
MPPIEVIINAGGGSFVENVTEQLLADAFSSNGLDANLRFAETGEQIVEYAKAAIASGSETIVAGGGDGTISTVAAEVVRSKKTLGVLPLGTLNNFSKDLQIPQDLSEAVRIIAEGHTRQIDVGEVNEHIFINNSSIGLYPNIVRRREKQQRLGRGKWAAALWATLRMFRLSPFLKVRIKVGDRTFLRKTPFVFVGNNEYEMDLYNIGRRVEMDGGDLSVYFLHRGGRWGVILLLLRTAFGMVKQWKDFEAVKIEETVIHTRRKRLHVAFDGEVRILESPLHYRIHPKALTVIVPEPTDPVL